MEAVSASDMTGIVIFTAGRQDAYEDYQRSVKEGHRLAEIKPYLPEEALEELEVASDDDHVHLWGTSVADKWQNVDPGDIALVYHDGQFVARGQVLFLNQNHSLAAHLWEESVDHDRWDPENPWEYLTFLTEVEEIDVDIEDSTVSSGTTIPTGLRGSHASQTSESLNLLTSKTPLRRHLPISLMQEKRSTR